MTTAPSRPGHRADLGALVRRAAARHGPRTAVACDEQSFTYAQLMDRATRLAGALRERGLGKGDRVALLGPNSIEQPEQLLGAALGGFVRVTCYAHETGETNAFMIRSTGSRVLLVHAAQLDKMRPHLDVLGVEHTWVYGGPAPGGTTSYEEVLADAPTTTPAVPVHAEDPHVIRFSAGTTGRPKGILHTAGAWGAILDEYRWVTPQLDERDVYLVAGQLSHAALLWFWQLLGVGGRLELMSAFDPGEFLRLVEQRRCSISLVVPTMISALLAHPDIATRDLSSLRCLNYAGAPIAQRTLTDAIATFGPILYQLYASSEIPIITMLQPHQQDPTGTGADPALLRSTGRPSPHTDIAIVDETGAALPPGQTGEIAVRNEMVMSAIWDDAEATAARFTPEGYLLTRDMGYRDEQGFLYIADRKEDMIISGGFNIWPAEVENAVASHPGVREVCVVGIPHERWGETPKAYVVLHDDVTADHDALATAIIATTREQLGPVKKATAVEFVPGLPKSGVGKIQRREVRAWHWGDQRIRVSGA
jgi:acyl-CoA synthetase (AMP-forming)/AMP-acid ligase II